MVTGSFLNEFATGVIGHDLYPGFVPMAGLVDVVDIRFDPDLYVGDGTITSRIPLILRNERGQTDETTVIARLETQQLFYMLAQDTSKGGVHCTSLLWTLVMALQH